MKKTKTKTGQVDFSTHSRWYVLANRTSAVIYMEGKDHEMHFVDRLFNERGRLQEANLDSDRPGSGTSSAGNGSIRHSLDRRFDQQEGIAKRFAKRIAENLGEACERKRFSDLVLVAEPHFLGLLRGELDSSTRGAVKHEIVREYKRGSDVEIHSHILKQMASL
jgi:protein required for attachment to host cells